MRRPPYCASTTNALDGRALGIEGDGADFPDGSKHCVGIAITEAKKIKIARRTMGIV